MCVKVKNKSIIIDYTFLDEFTKAAGRLTGSANFIYMSYTGSKFSLFFEGVSSYAVLSLPAQGGLESFTVGVASSNFLNVCKRLFEGEVELKLDKAKLHIKKGNINVSLAVLSKRAYILDPGGQDMPESMTEWFLDSLASVVNVDESLKSSGVQFQGVLFDNTPVSSRLCKFSRTSLALRSGEPIFKSNYRVVFQDEFASCARSLARSVQSVFLAGNGSGLNLKNGTKVFFGLVQDRYPLEYMAQWGLFPEIGMIPPETPNYTFVNTALFCAADLVSSVLGDLDHFIVFSTVGSSGDKLVWELYGKAFDGTFVSEKVLSTGGDPIAKFQLNKKSFLKLMSTFKDEEIRICDLNKSMLALSNMDGSAVALLSKAVV